LKIQKEIVIEFLRRWKIRNVKRIEPSELAETLQSLAEPVRVLRSTRKGLLEFDFTQELYVGGGRKKASALVGEIYRRLYNAEDGKNHPRGVGPTAASKILQGYIPNYS
jgi:hypothetical protein